MFLKILLLFINLFSLNYNCMLQNHPIMRIPLDSNFKIKVAVIALCLVVPTLVVWVQGYTSDCLPIIFYALETYRSVNWYIKNKCAAKHIGKKMSLSFVSKAITPSCSDFASFTFFITKPKSSCGHSGTLFSCWKHVTVSTVPADKPNL